MEPWQSWAIVGVAGAGAYWYYARSKNSNRTRGRASTSISQAQRRASEVREEGNKRRKKGKNAASTTRSVNDAADGSSPSVPTSGSEKTKKHNAGKTGFGQPAQTSAARSEGNQSTELTPEAGEDDDMDNEEFAKQLSSLKAGTSLQKTASAAETKGTKKSVKQNSSLQYPSNGKVAEPAGGASSHEMSTTSSTTGADADDDLSPAASPAFGATANTKHAGDVADMLEAPAKGPTVLRLTQPSEPQPKRQPKQKKVAPEPETKKQRQNRMKNEEKKAAREEAEKERRVLMEKQRRIAREAEGRPAKNGLGTSNPPATNAWIKPAEGGTLSTGSTIKDSKGGSALLDTFDEPTQPIGTITKTEVNGTTTTQKTWDREMPSEEEQLRMLSELDDNGWNTVQKGGKAKKKKNAPINDQASETDGSKAGSIVAEGTSNGNADSNDKKKNSKATFNERGLGTGSLGASNKDMAPPEPKKTTTHIDLTGYDQSNIHQHPSYDPKYPYGLLGHPDDSDWAVV